MFTRDGSILNAMNRLKRELERQREEYGIRWDENCFKVQRIMDHVRTPWNISNDYEDIETYVTQCVTQMQRYTGLYQTHSRDLRYSPVTAIINDIWYKIAQTRCYYEEEEIEKEKQRTYDAVIRTSVTLMDCLNKYDHQKREISHWSLELDRNLEKKSSFEGSIDKELHMKDSVFVAEQKLRLKELEVNISDTEKWIKRYTKSNEILLENIQSLKETLEAANFGLSQPTGGNVAEMSELQERLKNLNASVQKQITQADSAKQELESEMQAMEKLYESQKTEVHIYGI